MISLHNPARSHRELFIKIVLIDVRVLKHPLIELRVVVFDTRLQLLLLNPLETYVFNHFPRGRISLFLEPIEL
jgi:hypothetical protein